MSQIPETNPELAIKGPLPAGWVTEYSAQWNAWFYVDTKAPNPQAVWTHPLEKATTPSPAYTAEPEAGHSSTAAAPADQPANPDTRPLPQGWISQYSPEHRTFFYVNEAAADPGSTVTWTHPTEQHPPATDLKSPATASTQADTTIATAPGSSGGSTATASTDPARPPQNLPPGWKAEFDTNYKAWYYINTNDPSAGPMWTLPADAHSTSSPAGQQSGGVLSATTQPPYTGKSPQKTTEPLPSTTVPAASASTVPNPNAATAQTENPDKRPLPPGWITKFDENYKVWYYVDTTKPGNVATWEHPAENKTSSPGAPSTPGVGGTPAAYDASGAAPPNQQYGGQAPPAAGGGGLEGLIGGSAGKMVSGLFGTKARAQMDMFANKLAPEVNKLKGKVAGGSTSGQGQPGAPPAGPPGQYGAPPAHGQYGAPPVPAQGQYAAPPAPSQGQYAAPPAPGPAPYGSPPLPSQGQYGPPGAHSPVPGQGQPPGPGQGQGQYNPGQTPPPGGAYGAPGQPPPGQGGPGGLGGLNSLAGKFGKLGLGKK